MLCHSHMCNDVIGLSLLLVSVRLVSVYEITDISLQTEPNSTDISEGVILLKYNNTWNSVCHHGEPNTWGKREAIVACVQLGFNGGWPTEVRKTDGPRRHLYNFDCDGTETDIKNCGYEIADTCLDSNLAGIKCYDFFEVQLVGGSAPNAGRVEVRYDNTWSNVCYESRESETRQWSIYNVQVVCRQVGFPGAMLAKQGGQGSGMGRSIIDGYKCREDLRDSSLRECLPDLPIPLESTVNNPCGGSTGVGNDAVAICAVPGYIGCFSNTSLSPHEKTSLPNMSINWCRTHCRGQNYTHAYLHAGDMCYCGDQVNGRPVGDTECRDECAGDKDQVCGGNGKLSVYHVNMGACDDPLNGTDIYYYGDMFECGSSSPIQCVKGHSQERVMWNHSYVECIGQTRSPISNTLPEHKVLLSTSPFLITSSAIPGTEVNINWEINTRGKWVGFILGFLFPLIVLLISALIYFIRENVYCKCAIGYRGDIEAQQPQDEKEEQHDVTTPLNTEDNNETEEYYDTSENLVKDGTQNQNLTSSEKVNSNENNELEDETTSDDADDKFSMAPEPPTKRRSEDGKPT